METSLKSFAELWRVPHRQGARTVRFAVVLLLVCWGALLAHALQYVPFFADDGFVSLRYARRMLQGRGLTWDDYRRVEGYTNLLWTLGCAAFGMALGNPISAARVLGVAGAWAAQAAIVYAYRPTRRRGALPAFAGALTLALSGCVAVWAIGGLEQPLLGGLLAWGVALLSGSAESSPTTTAAPKANETSVAWPRGITSASVCLALACVTRADAALLVFCVLAGFVVGAGFARIAFTRAKRVALLPALFSVLQVFARRAYYGEWLPNSAFAKVAFTSHRLNDGVDYLKSAFEPMLPLLVAVPVAIVIALVSRSRRARLTTYLVPLFVWPVYVAVIGGDVFPARRHLVVIVVLLGFVIAEVLTALPEVLPLVRYLAWAGVMCALIYFWLLQTSDPEILRATVERWEWDAEPIGQMLRQGYTKEKPSLAVDASGSLPYFSELPSIDMLGLNEWQLAHRPPTDFGQGYLGHELGDGRYILSRKPDLVVFGVPTGDVKAPFRSGREMEADPSFAALYQLVCFETDAPRRITSLIWVRARDGRLGIKTEGARTRVPAFLLGNADAPVQLRDGAFVAVVSREAPGRIAPIDLEAGKWTVQLSYASGPLILSSDGERLITPQGGNSFSFQVVKSVESWSFAIVPEDAALARLGDVIFERSER